MAKRCIAKSGTCFRLLHHVGAGWYRLSKKLKGEDFRPEESIFCLCHSSKVKHLEPDTKWWVREQRPLPKSQYGTTMGEPAVQALIHIPHQTLNRHTVGHRKPRGPYRRPEAAGCNNSRWFLSKELSTIYHTASQNLTIAPN